MQIKGSNFVVDIGPCLFRGPGSYHVCLAWNRRDLFTGRLPPEGEVRFADMIEVWWRRGCWPRFSQYHMKWNQE